MTTSTVESISIEYDADDWQTITLEECEDVKDEWCDYDNPRTVTFQDVSAAAFRIANGIETTPCNRSHMSHLTGMEIYFKKDFLQYTGSFKERGARYTLLTLNEEQKQKGVIAASAGNHAQALAYHGKQLGVPITVVMPMYTPIMKVEKCKQYGARVIVKGDDMGQSKKIALNLGKRHGMLYINGYDHPSILAGQGTAGLEIVSQVPDVDAIIVPVGGGGMVAGIALAAKSMKPTVKIIAAESEKCPGFFNSFRAGKPTYTTSEPTLADGLAVPLVGCNAFATAKQFVDKCVVVREDYIALAILRLVELEKAVLEGAGATGLAAILQGCLPEFTGKKVVIVLGGGNIDTTLLGRCLERGLAADGRLLKFSITLPDKPGGLAEFTSTTAKLGISIKDIHQERTWLNADIFMVKVYCLAESRSRDHGDALRQALEKQYKFVEWDLQSIN